MRCGDGHHQGQMLVATFTTKLKIGHNDGSKYKAM
jgi:hypothetical protein